MREPVIIVNIFKDVIESMNPSLSPIVINYVHGRQTQILDKLQDLNNSPGLKNSKYPLFALYQDFPERRGDGYYGNVTIPKIIIACLTQFTDSPSVRYEKTFKPILYPVYYEFLHQLVRHKNINDEDEDFIKHTKWDRMGTLPVGSGLLDYIDAIEINNLSFTLSQIKTC